MRERTLRRYEVTMVLTRRIEKEVDEMQLWLRQKLDPIDDDEAVRVAVRYRDRHNVFDSIPPQGLAVSISLTLIDNDFLFHVTNLYAYRSLR